MFEKERHLSKGLREKMKKCVYDFFEDHEMDEDMISKRLLEVVQEAYEEGCEDDAKCDNCDERRGDPPDYSWRD